MSDQRVPWQVDGSSSQRGRKARPSLSDEQKQRERKRAMDRKAQRLSREKTRAHIAHLENMVQVLREMNESEATAELVAKVGRLQQENDHLRKIITAIQSALGSGGFESESQPRMDNKSRDCSRGGSQCRNTVAGDAEGSSNTGPKASQPSQPPMSAELGIVDQSSSNNTTCISSQNNSQLEDLPSTPQISEQPTAATARLTTTTLVPHSPSPAHAAAPALNYVDAWTTAPVRSHSWSTDPVTTVSNISDLRPRPQHSFPAILYPPPTISFANPPSVRAELPCRIWDKCNRIYAQMFSIKLSSPWAAEAITTGTIVRALRDGWGVMTSELRGNLVLRILRDIDQEIFPMLDRITRVAVIYKSHLLLKYFSNPNEENWKRMPIWQRPVRSQSAIPHPIAIDFFVWPTLRARLVAQHTKYFSTSAFSRAYQRHLRFSWPFDFDDAYVYDAKTDTYDISPLFAQYHRDIHCWGMEKEFFERFPELAGELGVAHWVGGTTTGERENISPAHSVRGVDEGEGGDSLDVDMGGSGQAGGVVKRVQDAALARGMQRGETDGGAGSKWLAGIAFENADVDVDAYAMELFNDLPCV